MMRRSLGILLAALVLGFFSRPVFADLLNMGYVAWDVTFPGNSGQFDIANMTGPNSTGDATFPVSTTVNLSGLSLTVDFSDGSTTVFGSSYFTLSGDGISFNGSAIPIGGTNPLPTDATLSGTFSPLSLTLFDGSTPTILASFSATILPSTGSTLSDGDLAIIEATTGTPTSAVPEPGAWLLLASGLVVVLPFRRMGFPGSARRLLSAKGHGLLCLAVFFVSMMLIAMPAGATVSSVQLSTWTSPDNGVAGVNNVNITASHVPSGTITPANVQVFLSKSACFGSTDATTTASSVKTVIGSTKRVNFNLPGTLSQDTYFAWISDSAAGDANFDSGNCSEVKVTHTNPTLAACIPTSSMGVLAPSSAGPVTAYVPNGAWSSSTTGLQIVQIEGAGSPTPTSIATPHVVNSCSSNPATGESVCVANNTDVYLLTGTTLNTTLSSGSNVFAGFSGGSCQNCGVAINALNNNAYIAMGFSPSPSGSAIQALDLATNTFSAPFPTTWEVSEDISIDPTRSLILSPAESNRYTLLQTGTTGTINSEFVNFVSTAGEFDSAAEDCSTGIALASLEFTSNVYITDLTQATFTPGSPGSWSAPQQVVNLPGAFFSAGTSGISVAPGSSHLAIVTGEFGGNTFAVLQLPSTSGTGTPAIVDFAFATMPTLPNGAGFSAGLDPHTLTAYTSPNDGKAYGVMAAGGPPPSFLGIIDLAAVLAAPRNAGTHTVSGAFDMNSVVRYVATH